MADLGTIKFAENGFMQRKTCLLTFSPWIKILPLSAICNSLPITNLVFKYLVLPLSWKQFFNPRYKCLG